MVGPATVRLEGLEMTVANLDELAKATRRNVLRRVLLKAGEPTAATASQNAPERSGRLAFSIAVSPQLSRRQRKESPREYEAEMYVGPSGGMGALNYASHVEFGTNETPAQPYMRPAWDATKDETLRIVQTELGREVERAAQRAARKAARIAAKASTIAG